MIRYTICPVEAQQTSKPLIRDEEYIANVFKHLEKNRLEVRLYNVPVGQRILLYQYVYGPDEFNCTYFTSTGVNSGYFSLWNAWPGRSQHLSFSEFTFE